MTDNEIKNWAFLSYSPQDNCEQRPDSPSVGRRCWGNWLHEALKTFSVPAEFAGQVNGRGEIIPERIDPVFQDAPESDEAALSAESRQALEQSICLIVVCSPRSAQSLRVNEAVRYFKQLGRGKYILPLVVAGEPNASMGSKPGTAREDECFVPSLRHPVQADGTLDLTRSAGKSIFVDARHGVDKREILANDHRAAEADLEMARIQLIALLLGVGFNGLWWREQKRHFFDYAAARQQTREALNQAEEARQQLQEAQRQTREAQHQVLEIQNLPRDVEGQIQAAQNQALEAQNQARDAQKQLQEFQNKVRDTQTQLEEARHRALAAESKVLEAQQQARETRNQLEEIRNQAREAQDKIQVKENLDVSNQNQEAQNQILAAQEQAQIAQSQLEETRRQAQDAQSKFLEAQSQVQEFQNQARSAASQLEEVRQQVREAESKVLTAQNQAREAQDKIQEIQNQTRDAQSQIQEAQHKARQARRLTQVLALIAVLAALAASLALRQRQVAGQAKSDSETAGKFALTLDGKEPIRQVLQNIGGAEQDEIRRRSLDQLAAGIPRAEIPEALKASAVIANDQERSHFQKWLLIRLGWENPRSALTCASAIEGNIVNDAGVSDSGLSLQLAVLDNWLPTDWPGALDWVCQMSDAAARQRLLEIILPALVADHPQATLTRLNSLQPVPDAGIYRMLFERWAAQDPVAAIQQRQQLPDQDQGDTMLRVILRTWVKQQPEAALTWVAAQPDTESKTNALAACLEALEISPSPDLPSALRPTPKAPWPWTEYLLNPLLGSLTLFPVETEANPANGPVQIQPNE